MIRIEEIERARELIGSEVVRTPLVRLDVSGAPCEIWLKLECLQPIGSFKIRGALNAIRAAPRGALSTGAVTASAGNMGQGVAWAARDAGVAATIVAPEQAPEAKLRAIERLGARVVEVPFEHWWRALEESRVEGMDGFFVHPFRDPHVMAGNGTIGLEIVDRLGEPDAVVVPVGGGGLISGVASALKATSPGTRVIAVEPSTAAPLAASLAAGTPLAIDRRRSFIDGAGGPSILPEMWPLLRALVDEAVSVTPEEAAAAVRLLVERARVVVEGAGALPVAAALAGHAGSGRVVAVVSGGNIDATVLATILRGETP